MIDIVDEAIEEVQKSQNAFCKFLSANDTSATGGHQAGMYIPNKVAEKLLDKTLTKGENLHFPIYIKWQNGAETESNLIYYGKAKNECRITGFAGKVQYFKPDYVGALFILVQLGGDQFKGYVFNTDDEIQTFLSNFGLSETETNRLIKETVEVNQEELEQQIIQDFVERYKDNFPTTTEMAREAREIQNTISRNTTDMVRNPDKKIVKWTEEEYTLFRILEEAQFGEQIKNGFLDIEAFLELAKSILNRRKSRAGKSFEHHLEALFDENGLSYTAQGITENNKKPDFIFPSIEAYKDPDFPLEKLVLLAAKTTCKDRWRQVITEADRLVDENKYLITLQQGISKNQMNEMQSEKVILVVPKAYISFYPPEYQNRIMTIKQFIDYVKELQNEEAVD